MSHNLSTMRNSAAGGDDKTSQPARQDDASLTGRVAPPQGIDIEGRKLQALCKAKVNFDSFSPVTQHGCYEFDRVIKSGKVLKRTRKTKSWKPVFLVLRPNQLSIYKDSEGTKLRHQLTLSDVTAVARQKDPKRQGHYVFGLFSPSRNYHIESRSEQDAQEWVELIRREARIDEEDEQMIMRSPSATRERAAPFVVRDRGAAIGTSSSDEQDFAVGSSGGARRPRVTTAPKEMHSARRPSNTFASFSGNEGGSVSDFSDLGGFPGSVTSLQNPAEPPGGKPARVPGENTIYGAGAGAGAAAATRPKAKRNASGMSIANANGNSNAPEDRVVYQGWLYLLKSHGGVRQWRLVWAVVRPRAFAIYKNEDEYSATLVVGFSAIQDAVDIDALSRSKTACFQLLTEEKNYRFCALGEDELTRWLGAFKSLLARRKEGELRGGGSAVKEA